MTMYYAAISGIDILALLILDCIILKSDVVSMQMRRFFHLALTVISLVIAAEIMTIFFGNIPTQYRALHVVGNVFGFSLSPLIPLLIGCGIQDSHRPGAFLFWIPPAVNFAASLLSAAFPLIFKVSDDNMYSRGDFFWIFLFAYGTGVLYLFLKTLAASKQYQNSNRFILLILFLFVMSGTSIQVLLPQLYISWLCISFAMCLYYVYYCELHHQIDGLTDLLNRHAYERHIRKIEGRKSAMVLIFDIDDFKSVNDRYGHPFGDFCITTIALCIKHVFFKTGLCFRTGGDEFCVISESANEVAIQRAYCQFLREIESMRKTEPRLPMVSIGYAYYDKTVSSVEETILQADQRMYHFKQHRKAAGAPPAQ